MQNLKTCGEFSGFRASAQQPLRELIPFLKPGRISNGGFRLTDNKARPDAVLGMSAHRAWFGASWQPITNFVITNSPVYFSDPAATNYHQRFYKAVMP